MLKIGKAAKLLGISIQTLHKWEQTGELVPDRKSNAGTRYYDADKLFSRIKFFEEKLYPRNLNNEDNPTIGYARVSSHDQKEDLVRQSELLETFCVAKGWRFKIISDLGSGMNYKKKGLNKLLELILKKKIRRIVLTHKDRLLRFGSELVFALCEIQGIEIVIINKGEQPSFEEELAKDVLEIITVFSARLYGSRSHKNKKLMEQLKKAVEEEK